MPRCYCRLYPVGRKPRSAVLFRDKLKVVVDLHGHHHPLRGREKKGRGPRVGEPSAWFTSGRVRGNTTKASPVPRIVIYRRCLGGERCCACTGRCARCDMDEKSGSNSGGDADALLDRPKRLERILCGIMVCRGSVDEAFHEIRARPFAGQWERPHLR